MEDNLIALSNAFDKLLKIKGECNCEINNNCRYSNLTVKQIYYLKIIGENEEMTFSKLAKVTHNSKPTITEMINKFIDYGCVYKKKSDEDKRVYYIYLTEEGAKIANTEERTRIKVVQRINRSLDEHEIMLLTEILNKIR
jgi:DNA-binding MarR family transcriptional regulator